MAYGQGAEASGRKGAEGAGSVREGGMQGKGKSKCEARERVEWEAWEKYKQDLEFYVKRAEEERQRHEAVA